MIFVIHFLIIDAKFLISHFGDLILVIFKITHLLNFNLHISLGLVDVTDYPKVFLLSKIFIYVFDILLI